MKPKLSESVTVRRSLISGFAGFVLGVGMAHNAFATPTGATVVHGSAQFAMPSANTLEITNSANAIINWQSFNIGQGETTRFIQPSTDSAVLNRVTGVNPSELLGNLSSNGRVFLINPHGIVVGENAVIDVAGFVASTLNLNDEDFLNGRYNFQGENAGALINRGFITAGPGGEIVLIAPQIENHGALSVDDGALLLAAGEKVTLTRFDLNGIEFEVQAPDNRVINLGELIARRGAVGVFAGSIDQQGIIEAGSLGFDAAGNIVLRAKDAVTVGSGARIAANGSDGGNISIQTLEGDTFVSGDVEAVGQDGKGGSIQILGERVGLIEQAGINASGADGGGEILAGGDYRGLSPDIQNASGTFVGEDVSLAADATKEGDGGRVIVWADEATRMYGGISVTGGSIGGDGGFVETSGKQYLEVGNHVPDVSAVNGTAGEWLLDPRNITIQSVAVTPVLDGQSPNFLPTADNSTISSSVISAALTGGTTVTIDTNSPSGTQEGDVTFNSPINAAGAGTLNVRADGDIFVNAGITANASGPLNIDFESNRDQADGFGGIQVISTINTNNGNARFISRGDLVGGAGEGVIMNNASGAVNSGLGEIFIQAQTGPISLTGGTESALQSDNRVTLEADGFVFNFGAVSADTFFGPTSLAELRTFSIDIDLGTSAGGLQVDDALLGPINASNLVITSAAGHDVRTGQEVVTLSVDTTINSGRNIFFNNTSLPGLLADDINLTLDAAGSIIDSNPGGIDIDATSASSLTLQAAQGIQAEVNVTSLRFDNSDGGVVDIVNRSADPVTMLLGGTNGGNGATTIDYASDIEIAGDISHGPGSLTIIGTGIINDVGVNITGAGGGIRLVSANVTNNGIISDSGGVLIDTNGLGFTNSTSGVINNAGGSGDIVIRANNIDLAGSLVDAGAVAKTVLTPVDGANWTLGGTGTDLSEADLDAILHNITLGSGDGSLLGVNVVGQVGLTNGQNLTIQPSGGAIVFNQNGAGILTTGDVVLGASGIMNGAPGVDVVANRLTVNSTSGIDLETQINELIALNDDGFGTTTGSISIANSGSDLTVAAPGVRNVAAAGDIAITNTSGSLFVDGLIDAVGGNITLTANAPGTDIVAKTDIVAAGDIALTAGRDLIVHAGPGPTTHARVRAGNTLNLATGGNLIVTADTVANEAAIVSDSVSLGSENGVELQAGDTVLVGNVLSGGLLDMSGGSVTVNGDSSIGGLTMTGGVLDGAGNINVGGATTWSGGIMQGTGVTTANGGLDINGASSLNRVLINAGAGTWQGVSDLGGTGTFNNQAGASLDITNDQNMTVAFNNAGTVTKSSTGTTQFNVYTQTGGVSTFAGTVAIDALTLSGGMMGGTGNLFVPTSFNWTGGTLDGTGITTSSGILLMDGAVTLNRTLDNNGSAVWQGTNNIGGTGTFNNRAAAVFDITNDQAMFPAFNNAGTVNKTGTGITQFLNYNQTGGASTFAGQVNVDTLDLGGGSLDGGGDVIVATTFNWTGGAMAGGGTTTSNNNLLIDGAVTLDRALNNAGNGTWQGAFDIAGTGTFNNLAGGTLNIANDQSMTVALNNAGTVTKGGTGTTQFGSYTQNNGVSIFSGIADIDTLMLAGGALDGDGSVNVATAFNWTGGSMVGTGSTTVDGSLLIDGAVVLGRTLNNNGSGVWQGANDISGAGGIFNNLATAVFDIVNDQNMNATFNNAGTVNKSSTGTTLFSDYTQSSGMSAFAGTVGAGTLSLGGGSVTGDGNINVGSLFAWNGGAMTGTGTTTSNSSLIIDGAVTLDRTLVNNGSGVWQGANDIAGTGTFNNLGGANLTIMNDQSMSVAFNNAGNVSKASTGTTQFNGYTQSSGVSTLAGTVNIDTLNLGGGMMGGDGDFNIATQFNWTGGVMGGAGTTTVNGDLLIDGAVTLDRTLINNGSGVWQGAGNIDGAGLFENPGLAVLSIDNNQNMNIAFDNAGVVTKTSTGTTLFSSYNQAGGTTTFAGTVGISALSLSGGTLDGDGSINVGAQFNWTGGAMAGAGTTTSNGDLLIGGAVTLDRSLNNAGSGIWQGAFDIAGTGTFNNLSTADLEIANDRSMAVAFNNAGAVTKSSTGTTQFGDYTQNGGMSTLVGTVDIDTLNLGGGSLNGAGNVNVATNFSWTGGTLAGTGATVVNGGLLIDGGVTLDSTLNNNGSGVWQGAGDIGGTGTFNNLASAVLDIANDQSMNATFNNAGTVNKLSTGATMFLNYAQTGGTATLAGLVGIDTLNLSGGALGGDGSINIGTQFNWTGGAMAGNGTTTSNGDLLIGGAVTLDRTFNNAANGVWQGTSDIGGSGVFNNAAGGVFRIDNDQFMGVAFNNAGAVIKTGTGVTSFAGGYQQVSGITRLNGGTLELPDGELLLAGGALTGTGTVRALTLNHSGGWIAPGSFVDPDADNANASAQYGVLTIDGDLQMGGDAGIALDLGVSNERGGIAGADFDLLDITGNAGLAGRLVLSVDANRFNLAIGETFRPVMRYGSRSGEFSAANVFPVGYGVSPTILPQGLGLRVTAIPFFSTRFIPDDELERLRDELRENIARLKLERERRRKEDEEDEKRRRALMCS